MILDLNHISNYIDIFYISRYFFNISLNHKNHVSYCFYYEYLGHHRKEAFIQHLIVIENCAT